VQPVGRRTRVVVRKVGPWSVLKFSLLFYLCMAERHSRMIIYGLLSAWSDRLGGTAGVRVRDGSAGQARSS
jgi:hypothetical protein